MADLTVTNADVWAFTDTSAGVPLLARVGQWPLAFDAAWAVVCWEGELAAAKRNIEAFRTKLCEQFAEKDAAGAAVLMPDGLNYAMTDTAGFLTAFAQLLAQEVVLHEVRPLTHAELQGVTGILPADLRQLGPFLVKA